VQIYFLIINQFPAELHADYIVFVHHLLRMFLRIWFRKQGHGQGIPLNTAQKFPADYHASIFAGKFPAVPKILRKQLPTKLLAGNLNPWQIPQEIAFLRKFSLNP